MKRSTKNTWINFTGVILSALIGSCGGYAWKSYQVSHQIQSQVQNQSFTINIDGKDVQLSEKEVYDTVTDLKEENDTLEKQVAILEETQMSPSSETNGYETYDYPLYVNGNKSAVDSNESVAKCNQHMYIRDDIVTLLNQDYKIDNDDKKIIVGDDEGEETVYLMDVCPPYETPYDYRAESFKMCGEWFYNGFAVGSPDENAVLINLDEKYSQMEFDFGHVDETEKKSARMCIYLDGNMEKTIEKDADEYYRKETVDLKKAKQLKITINTGIDGYYGEYGLGNILLRK